MKKARSFVTAVTLAGFVMLAAPGWAAGVYDGSWEGTTSQGWTFGFQVSGDEITIMNYCVEYSCPSGITQHVCHGRGAGTGFPIRANGTFTGAFGVVSLKITNGEQSPAITMGEFSDPASASGKIIAGYAAFRGEGLKTQACSFRGTWEANKVSPVAVPPEEIPQGTFVRPGLGAVPASGPWPALPGAYDGDWPGTTSQDHPFSLGIKDDLIKDLGYGVDYTCPSGAVKIYTHGISGASYQVRLNGTFVAPINVSPWRPMDGYGFAAVIVGRFPSPVKASGRNLHGIAAFNGKGLQTEACTHTGTWTADRQ